MPESAWTTIAPNRSIWPLTLRDFWKWRQAFYRMVLREFQVRFRDTYLGYIWIVLQPLLMLALILIFLRDTGTYQSEISFHLYVLSGLVFWFFIANGFTHGSSSMIDNRSLVTQTNLKRVLIPAAIVSSKLFDLFISLMILAIWIAVDPREDFLATNMLVLVDVAGLFFLVMGLAMIFSALCVQFKDIRYIISFCSQLLFFACPIFYMYPEKIKDVVLVLNPFAVFLLAVRDHIFGTSYVSLDNYMIGFGMSLGFFLFGAVVFRKFEKTFADVI